VAIKKYSDFDHSSEEKPNVETKTIKNNVIESKPIKEEILLAPKSTGNSSIEILEENIIKFNDGHIKDILETIKNKYSNTDYFFRRKDNELHVVKYNEKLNLNINEFINSLLKFYSTSEKTRNITEGIKVKGNNNFTIIENMKSQFTNKFVDDLTRLLSKKNEK